MAFESSKIEYYNVELINLGLIDTLQKGMEAGLQLHKADVDIIFRYETTYALSSTASPVVHNC